jgi:hypothetical protein
MAMIGSLLAAEQAVRFMQGMGPPVLNSPISHQAQESMFVFFPCTSILLEGIEHILRGREIRSVNVIYPGNHFKKICKILFLGEAGKLGDVIKTYVNNPFDARIS